VIAVVIEILILLVVVLLAAGLAAPARRRTNPDRPGLGSFIHHLLLPGLVLALTPAVVLLLEMWAPAAEYMTANPMHQPAWQVFWLGILILGLVESIVRQVIALRGHDWPVPDLLEDILRTLLILLLAFVVLKVELGWNIGPLLASTALVTAVLGFALQGVLGNLLSGMSLHLTRTVKQGDWISMTGVEGRVKRTNWRETRIITVNGHELVVPNTTVAGAVLHNMNHPTPVRRQSVDVGASYSDEPDEVIAALEEAAREVAEVLPKPAPEAIVTAFEDYGINYQLRFWTKQYHRRQWIDGQVCRHIWYKFKRRGIEIPFPMSDKLLNDFMTVVYSQRKLEPEGPDRASIVRDLMASDLHSKVFTDAEGGPLLQRDDYELLGPLVHRQLYTRGETLMSEGDEGDTFHVLVAGELKGSIEGTPPITFTIEPGSVVGEMSLLTGEVRSATLTTAGSCELLTFDREAFVALLALREEIPERLADLAAERAAANRAAADKGRQGQKAALDSGERSGFLNRLLGLLKR